MSTVISKNMQVGTSGTPAQNFTLYQPATPDGTVRLANGNSGSTTDLLVVDSSGDLGVGVVPSPWLSTTKALQLPTGSLFSPNNGSLALAANVYTDGTSTNRYVANNFATYHDQTNGTYRWFTAPSGTAGNAISFSQAMTLDANGLGLDSTRNYLMAGSGFVYSYGGGTSAQVRSGIYYDGSGTTLQFYTAQSERARITSSGGFIVGGTVSGDGPVAGNITTGSLFVNTTSTVSGSASVVNVEHSGGSYYGIMLKNRSTDISSALTFVNSSTAVVGSVQTTTTATTYNTSSDYRLKENIQPMTGALAKVAALKPVTYKWKSTGEDAQGFIAHELQEVCPQAVSGEKDGLDSEGNPKYQGIDTSFLVATLTAAIQELKAEFDAYKASHP